MPEMNMMATRATDRDSSPRVASLLQAPVTDPNKLTPTSPTELDVLLSDADKLTEAEWKEIFGELTDAEIYSFIYRTPVEVMEGARRVTYEPDDAPLHRLFYSQVRKLVRRRRCLIWHIYRRYDIFRTGKGGTVIQPSTHLDKWEKENRLKAEICEYVLPKSLEYIWLRWKQATGDSVLCRIQRKDDRIWGISLQAARAIAIAGMPFLSKVVLNKEEWRTVYDVEGSERDFKACSRVAPTRLLVSQGPPDSFHLRHQQVEAVHLEVAMVSLALISGAEKLPLLRLTAPNVLTLEMTTSLWGVSKNKCLRLLLRPL